MASEIDNSPVLLAEMLLHLGRLAQGEAQGGALSTAQWTALRYLDSANNYSRTPSAFARFHGTTRGTASQTIRSLVKQGLLTQSRAKGDGRSRQLNLTEKAKAMRLCDPFDAVVRAAGELPVAARRQLAVSLDQMLHRVACEKGERPFGTCTACTHLECDQHGTPKRETYTCGVTENLLDIRDLDLLCVNFRRTEASAGPGRRAV